MLTTKRPVGSGRCSSYKFVSPELAESSVDIVPLGVAAALSLKRITSIGLGMAITHVTQ
jgi:hypothetical protein